MGLEIFRKENDDDDNSSVNFDIILSDLSQDDNLADFTITNPRLADISDSDDKE